jgi:hypothetical protein
MFSIGRFAGEPNGDMGDDSCNEIESGMRRFCQNPKASCQEASNYFLLVRKTAAPTERSASCDLPWNGALFIIDV